MAEPLRNHFTLDVPRRLAEAVSRVWPRFEAKAFLTDVADGFEALELMDRGRHIARVLHRHLPADYPTAIDVLLRSVGHRPARSEGDGGMASFFYLPHVSFVAEFGLEHFDESMHAQYVLTQRFTAEFSIRPFIERYEREALTMLRTWARDPDVHVRRLVSEGTRPRLPWAGRLRRFQQDPSPVLALLEQLKDDPELYVRRSVANNLNDIGKDHPAVLVDVARRWMEGAGAERKALVRHALRSLVKEGHTGALTVLGFGRDADVTIEDVVIAPKRVERGGKVVVAFTVRSTARRAQRVLVDLRLHFVKARGKASPKVFKLKAADLDGGATMSCRKTVSLADLTTRQHYPGKHLVDALVNGRVVPIGAFTLTA
ncbi:MAG: DNA alkylation repair protein [Acidobacteria bacterium]|nr:DNA alkylation repair protein [Acidobacteriota bacterium]